MSGTDPKGARWCPYVTWTARWGMLIRIGLNAMHNWTKALGVFYRHLYLHRKFAGLQGR